MNDVPRAQTTGASYRRLADPYWAMGVALVLHGRSRCATNRAGDAAAELQVVVRGVDDCVDLLLDQVAGDDQDSCLMVAHSSSIRRSRICGVAFAIPRTPIASIVKDAQATPQTRAS